MLQDAVPTPGKVCVQFLEKKRAVCDAVYHAVRTPISHGCGVAIMSVLGQPAGGR